MIFRCVSVLTALWVLWGCSSQSSWERTYGPRLPVEMQSLGEQPSLPLHQPHARLVIRMAPLSRQASAGTRGWGTRANWTVRFDDRRFSLLQLDKPDFRPDGDQEVRLLGPGRHHLKVQAKLGRWTDYKESRTRWKTSTVAEFPVQTFEAGAEYTLELSEQAVVFYRSRPGSGERIILREDFNDNARGWPFAIDAKSTVTIESGKYKIAVRPEQSAGFNSLIELPAGQAADFSIEARLRQVQEGYFPTWDETKVVGGDVQRSRKSTIPARGIVYAVRPRGSGSDPKTSGPSFSALLIGGYQYAAGAVGSLFWSPRSDYSEGGIIIRPRGQDDTLTVIRAGDGVEYYINGVLVSVRPSADSWGGRLGFFVAAPTIGTHVVEVDYLLVKQLAPTIPRGHRQELRYELRWEDVD